jgi:hypothetical protein
MESMVTIEKSYLDTLLRRYVLDSVDHRARVLSSPRSTDLLTNSELINSD